MSYTCLIWESILNTFSTAHYNYNNYIVVSDPCIHSYLLVVGSKKSAEKNTVVPYIIWQCDVLEKHSERMRVQSVKLSVWVHLEDSTLPPVFHSHTVLLCQSGRCHIQRYRSHLMTRAGFSGTRLLRLGPASQSLFRCSCWSWWHRYRVTGTDMDGNVHLERHRICIVLYAHTVFTFSILCQLNILGKMFFTWQKIP